MKTIVSFSGGKDSTWMLLEMIRRGEHIDEVVFFDTGWEFPQMLSHVERIKALVEENGITFTTLHPEKSFDWNMFERPVNVGKPNEHLGYSWCGLKGCRWGTAQKTQTIDKHYKSEPEHIQCVGIAADELDRIKDDPNKRYPLVEWGITEAECLAGCYAAGYDWGGLYEWLDRVSCKFCALKNLKELRNIYSYIPEVWAELRDYQRRTNRPYRNDGATIFDLEKRFELEWEFAAAGKSIRDKTFFDALREASGRDEP